MHFLRWLALVLAAIAGVESAAVSNSYIVHAKREITSSQWAKGEKLPSEAILSMRIGLKQRNLDRGHDLLMDVSDPNSNNYAKYWTSEEVIDMFAPEQDTVDLVTKWLVDSGIDLDRITHSDNKGWLAFDANAEEAESLLRTKYHIFEHSALGHMAAACDSYHVPEHIQEHLDYITPGIELLAPSDLAAFKSELSENEVSELLAQNLAKPVCSHHWITPACIRALYKAPDTKYPLRKPRSDNSLGIYASGHFWSQKHLDSFFSLFKPNIPNGTHPISAFKSYSAGLDLPNRESQESDLDFQIAYPLIYPQTTTNYQADDLNSQNGDSFDKILKAIDGSYCTRDELDKEGTYVEDNSEGPTGYHPPPMCGISKRPNVLSFSYGLDASQLSQNFQKRECNEYMKLGLRGTSIIFSSGDFGVAGHGGRCQGSAKNIFDEHFPSSCPYVTSVGATRIIPGLTEHAPEVAAYETHRGKATFSSGGGFSNAFPVPEYQKEAVDAYFKNATIPYKSYSGFANKGKDGGVYNRDGRGYPDVSAIGQHIVIVSKNHKESGITTVHGTSASAPIFAALINNINEMRLNAGKKPLGFLNPAIYKNPGIWNDVTEGWNPGCGTDGFQAREGWDPVTGLGTPNFPKMVEYFMGLP